MPPLLFRLTDRHTFSLVESVTFLCRDRSNSMLIGWTITGEK
jgi:hypothetical protein